jgi:hypothetical protein
MATSVDELRACSAYVLQQPSETSKLLSLNTPSSRLCLVDEPWSGGRPSQLEVPLAGPGLWRTIPDCRDERAAADARGFATCACDVDSAGEKEEVLSFQLAKRSFERSLIH